MALDKSLILVSSVRCGELRERAELSRQSRKTSLQLDFTQGKHRRQKGKYHFLFCIFLNLLHLFKIIAQLALTIMAAMANYGKLWQRKLTKTKIQEKKTYVPLKTPFAFQPQKTANVSAIPKSTT